MFGGELYSKEELLQMLENTRGFYDYCKLKEQLEREEGVHGAFSWLFEPSFVPLPIDPDHMNHLSKGDIWWVSTRISEAFNRHWNTPREFRDREYKFRV